MGGVAFRFRGQLRTRWPVWLALAVLLGAVAGTVLVFAAGARRTGSAHHRFLAAQRAYDVAVVTSCTGDPPPEVGAGLDTSCLDDIAGLPAVADATIATILPAYVATAKGRSLQPIPTDPCYSGPDAVRVVADPTGRFGTAINTYRFVEGRPADPAVPDEVVISQETAQRHGLGLGSELRVLLFDGSGCQGDPAKWLAPVSLVRVVGVQLSPGEVAPPSGLYIPTVAVTPAFVKASGDISDRLEHLLVRLRPGTSSDILRREALNAGYAIRVVVEQADAVKAVERGIRPITVSLAVLAAITALAGAAAIGQLVVRQTWVESGDEPILAALGMSRRDRLALGLLRAGVIGTAAALLAAAVSVAASPLMPVGLARRVEPDRGFALDAAVIGLGALVIVGFVLTVTALTAWRLTSAVGRAASDGRGNRAVVANAAARVGFAPAVVSGVHFALDRGSGARAVPVASSFVGVTIAVAGVVGALTFGAGLDHLRDTPRLAGWNWDLVLWYPEAADPNDALVPAPRARVEGALRAHGGVEDYALGTWWPPFPLGRPLQVGSDRLEVDGLVSFDGAASVGPSVIAGRKPSAPEEILLGPETLEDLGLRVGDRVEVIGQAGPEGQPGVETSARVQVVGTGVVPISQRLGRGAAMTLEGLARLTHDAKERAVYVRLAPGAEADAVKDAFRAAFPEVPRESLEEVGFDSLPTGVLNLDAIDSIDSVREPFAVLMGVMAASVLAHVLFTATRARRRDLAVLRAVGFSRGQTVRTVAYQATVYVAVAVAVGLPAGLVVGRLAWRLYADSLNVVPEPVTPWPALGVVAAVVVAGALLIGLVPAWRSARVQPALILRSE